MWFLFIQLITTSFTVYLSKLCWFPIAISPEYTIYEDHEQLFALDYLYRDSVSSMDFNCVYSCTSIGSKLYGTGSMWPLLMEKGCRLDSTA
jgi:hypothetical protein